MTALQFWLAAGLMAAATYATRLPGLLLARPLPGFLGRALAAVPAAVFAALAAPGLLTAATPSGPSLALRPGALLPALVAWLVARRARRADVALGAGFLAAIVARLAGL